MNNPYGNQKGETWETRITTVDGPEYAEVFEALGETPAFQLTFRIFLVVLPVNITAIRLRFTAEKV